MENDDSIANKNLEEYENKINVDKASNEAIINQEITEDDDDSLVIKDIKLDAKRKRSDIKNQYNQSNQLTEERIKFQDFKQRNMEEFTNDYSISQVIPNGWTTFFNILSTIFFSFAVIIAACIAICLIFRISIGIVPTDSMEPTIPSGSLIFYKPIAEEDISLKEIQDGEPNTNIILCYSYNGTLYVHRLTDIKQEPNDPTRYYVMVGDNQNLKDAEGKPIAHHTIKYENVQGELVFCVHNLGVVIYFIKNNLLLTLSIFCMFTFGIMLLRNIVERNHAREEIEVFVDKKAEFEKQNEEKLEEMKKEANKREFDRLLETDYSRTPERDRTTKNDDN